ncbi:hypothetical protein DFP94_1011180 [Fontibacillus phaseoli]|uniref:Uncharacterized protein n=1 Tax=Fontibacillus phaseoli TaxID=1416533 RepID=A0A369BQ98_9BACL|nr:hypothetical protein DFP94_1011180 [Fontibacillus phaseoli]
MNHYSHTLPMYVHFDRRVRLYLKIINFNKNTFGMQKTYLLYWPGIGEYNEGSSEFIVKFYDEY